MLNKKGSVITDKTIIIILVILVVGSVLLFIFRVDILSNFKLLPSFSPEEDQSNVEDGNVNGDTNVVPDEQIPNECDVIGRITPDVEKSLIFKSTLLGNYIIYLGNTKTGLHLDKEKGVDIKVARTGWFDSKIGSLVTSTDGKQTLTFDTSSSAYRDYASTTTNQNILNQLDGAYYLKNFNNVLCKKLEGSS